MKEFLEGFLDRLETKTEPNDGEYLCDDGLLYCEKCHTPVQCRKMFLGKMRTLPCICKCKQEEMRREKEEAEAREQMIQIRKQTRSDGQRNMLRNGERSRRKTLAFCFGATLVQENPLWQPALPMPCWNRWFRS